MERVAVLSQNLWLNLMKLQLPRLPECPVHFILRRCRPLANCAAAVIILLFLLLRHPASGADHRDAPFVGNDEASLDLNDLYVFRDLNDSTRVVLIATVHGFIVPGEASNEAAFASNAVYRFEIYNEHVNLESPLLDPEATRSEKKAFLQKVKPNRVIDVTFSKREVGPEPQPNDTGGTIPPNLRRPKPQEATLKLQGFKGIDGRPLANRGRFDRNTLDQPLTVSPISSGPITLTFTVHNINISPGLNIEFFAGMTDDPFFADLPALAAFLDSIRNGAPSTAAFSRGRDTFAGYNTMAIALRIPAALLQGENGTKIGVNAVTLRQAIQRFTKSGTKDSGTLRTIDRVGVPMVNTLLIPFDLKDTYNMSNVHADGSVRFIADSIGQTLANLGLVTEPPEPSVVALSKLVIAHGDLLQLDLSIPNTGTNPAAAFPNGRRVHDDTVAYVLTAVNHSATLDDNVHTNELPPNLAFPFLAPPHQPLFTDTVDDRTRN
jgi:Domain of unknown function (DUF4331)